MNDLFSASNPTDPEYLSIRDNEWCDNLRSHLRSLWEKYHPHAEPNFIKELGKQFHQRYWEMRLGCTLLELGHELTPRKSDRPDFDIITSEGVRVYVEAVAVQPGDSPDAVPEPNWGSDETGSYPSKQVIFRIRSAIENKTSQHAGHLAKGRIDPSVPYVIAINIGGIIRAFVQDLPPTLAQACLGVDTLRVVFSQDAPHEIGFTKCDAIPKSSGELVDTRIFLNPQYRWLSGVLLSDISASIFNIKARNFQFLHNPMAKYPLTRHWFPVGQELWYEDGQLHSHSHEHVDA